MNLKMGLSLCWIAIWAVLFPSLAPATVAPWRFRSVKSYGALGNGTVDDTSAIDRAIAGGNVVYFPPGTYLYVGPMTLPPNKSYRIYGDGPGVSTILFRNTGLPNAGLNANLGTATLNVEGLTFKADSKNCGTAITALFSESGASTKFHTATIHNIQIIGSDRTGACGSYWTNGIHLHQAQNAVVDKVHIYGNNRDKETGGPPSQKAIVWDSANDYKTTGLQMSGLEVLFFNTALETSGWVEGLYVFGFEFILCGQHGMPAVNLNAYDPEEPGPINPGNLKPAFHLFNGHVDIIEHGISLKNLRSVKLSKLVLLHNTCAAESGSMVTFKRCFDARVSQCTFVGVDLCSQVPVEDGIFLDNAHSVQIDGNFFTHMEPIVDGSSITIFPSSNLVRITDNTFGNLYGPVLLSYNDGASDTYYRGNANPVLIRPPLPQPTPSCPCPTPSGCSIPFWTMPRPPKTG